MRQLRSPSSPTLVTLFARSGVASQWSALRDPPNHRRDQNPSRMRWPLLLSAGEKYVDPSEHRGRSIGNAHCIQTSGSDISHDVDDFRARLASLGWGAQCLRVDPHRAQISKKFFYQAELRGIFVDPAEAHWHIEQVESNARYLRRMGNRTMEHLDIDEADFQQLLNELTDAANNLVQHNGYVPRQWVVG